MFDFRERNVNNLRVIKTARSVEEMNEAAENGLRPWIQKLEPSSEITSKYAVVQNRKTGRVHYLGDYRSLEYKDRENFDLLIPWTRHYPYKFDLPFAAYLIPEDLEINEHVYLDDLIEDIVGSTWNQGDCFRLAHCEAIWKGWSRGFHILFNPRIDRNDLIG